MKPTRALVFDLDGTLFDSLPSVLRALNHAVAPFSSKTLTMDVFPLLGGPPERFLHSLVDDPKNVPLALKRLEDHIKVHGWVIEPFDGALKLVTELSAAGASLAIWTGRDRDSASALFAQYKITNCFSVVVCGDDFETHKPDPEGMNAIRKQLGLSPEQVLFIGDSDVDAQAGHASGVRTVLISHGRTIPTEIQSLCWKVVRTTADGYTQARLWAAGEG